LQRKAKWSGEKARRNFEREKEVSLGWSKPRLVVGYGKERAERKDEAMIARFDHRPLLTAVLALTTAVLTVVVITLATLFITAPSTAPATSGSVGENPPVVGAGGEHYGEGWNNYGHDTNRP
jgi:hypothetical protein